MPVLGEALQVPGDGVALVERLQRHQQIAGDADHRPSRLGQRADLRNRGRRGHGRARLESIDPRRRSRVSGGEGHERGLLQTRAQRRHVAISIIADGERCGQPLVAVGVRPLERAGAGGDPARRRFADDAGDGGDRLNLGHLDEAEDVGALGIVRALWPHAVGRADGDAMRGAGCEQHHLVFALGDAHEGGGHEIGDAEHLAIAPPFHLRMLQVVLRVDEGRRVLEHVAIAHALAWRAAAADRGSR